MNAPVRPPLVLTDDQFEDMARKGAFTKVGRVELRGGVIVAMSPVHLSHSRVTRELLFALTRAMASSSLPFEINAEITIRFGGGFQPTVDLVVWQPDPALVDGPIPGAAARLVIEVADASLADDLGGKLLDYAQTGLAEYWVADVKARMIVQNADPGPEGYATRRLHPFGETLAALTLPLAVDTSAL